MQIRNWDKSQNEEYLWEEWVKAGAQLKLGNNIVPYESHRVRYI